MAQCWSKRLLYFCRTEKKNHDLRDEESLPINYPQVEDCETYCQYLNGNDNHCQDPLGQSEGANYYGYTLSTCFGLMEITADRRI